MKRVVWIWTALLAACWTPASAQAPGAPPELDVEARLAAPLDPDPAARVEHARALGAIELGSRLGAERVAWLVERASSDGDGAVRAAAIEALGASGLPGAARALDGLFGGVTDEEERLVAEALVPLAAARELVVARVQAEFAGPPTLATRALVVLLEAYGPALADRPGGAESAAERAPFVLGAVHPERRVVVATERAVQALFDRLQLLGDEARTDRVLAAFGDSGYRPYEMLYRRAYLALARRGDPARALVHADALIAAPRRGDARARSWPAYGWHFRGAALFALGRFAEARDAFKRAGERMGALIAEREDLRPDLFRPRTRFPQAPAGGAILVDRLELVALEELWQALSILAEENASDAAIERALVHARQAHEHQWRSELLALGTDTEAGATTWDLLFEDDLAPARLLLAGRGDTPIALDDTLTWQRWLGRLAATVAPGEVPGFEPWPSELPWLDPFADDARFALMLAAEAAELNQAARDWNATQERLAERAATDGGLLEPGDIRNHPKLLREFGLRRRILERERALDGRDTGDVAVRRDAFRSLAEMRVPSTLALRLGQRLRGEGRSTEARQHAQRALKDLEREALGAGTLWLERTRADLELVVGASYTDEDEPELAETALLGAVRRLDALENTLVERRRASADDVEFDRTFEAWIAETRRMRGAALTSLAVNANVRLGEPERALEFFETAFELDPSDFNRILLACYRARSGKHDEARAILESVAVEPALYYNLACTHALLGEHDLALDYLAREFRENHPNRESRERQQRWAASDPDLSSLADDPRFQRLVGGR